MQDFKIRKVTTEAYLMQKLLEPKISCANITAHEFRNTIYGFDEKFI